MSRKVTEGRVELKAPQKVVKWNRGRRTVTRKKTRIDKYGVISEHESTHSFNFGGLISLIAVILLGAGLASTFIGSSDKSFYSFLLMLQNIPDIIPAEKIVEFFNLFEINFNLPNWLSWLEPLYNSFVSLWTLLAFIVKGSLSAAMLLLHIVRWIFI